MALSLTHEQKIKLQKLDEEIKLKKEYEIKNLSRKQASSIATGIPIDIVDMDVIKIGTLLGLIKKKSVLEGKEPKTTNFLLDLLLGNNEKEIQFDYSKIPKHYKTTQEKVTEYEKINYHQEFVQKQCTYFSEITINTIKSQLTIIQKHILINLEQLSIPVFISNIKENMEVIFNELIDTNDDSEEDELWLILSVLRNSILGPINICEYKQILVEQILHLRKSNKSHKKILNHLSLVESRLILYPGGLHLIKDPLSQDDISKLITELQFRTFTKNPQLQPFEISNITKDCCTPSLLHLPLDIVLKISMLGPYMNNSIGYLNNLLNSNDSCGSKTNPWSFYVLSTINTDGSRLWVLDYKIKTFSLIFITSITNYLIKIFRTFYKENFGTNNFIDAFYKKTYHFDVYLNIIRNLIFISKHSLFVEFLKDIIIQKSCIIPTEYDFFNHLVHYEDDEDQNKITSITLFEQNFQNLFDTPINTDIIKEFEKL